MRIRIRNLAAILVVCVVGFFSGTAADSGASRPKSGGSLQPAPAPVNPDGRGPARTLADREAKPEGKVTLPSGTSQDWWSKVQENIRKDEYQVTWDANASFPGTKGAWQAPNRVQGFRTYFTENGVRLIPRVEGSSPWEWGLQLVRWGRGEVTEPVAKVTPHITGNRVEFSRAHIAEWFVNDEQGLEQGFTISAPPSKGRAPPPSGAVSRQASPVSPREGTVALPYALTLDLALTGTLHPKFAEDGQAVDFYGGNIGVLRYGQLKVTDASGRVLPSRFEGWAGSLSPHSELPILNSSGAIRIAIDDTAALYPITVDPLATSPAWTAESDQASA